MAKECEACGRPIVGGRPRRFCNRTCQLAAYERPKYRVRCPQCREVFLTEHKAAKFCSRGCVSLYHSPLHRAQWTVPLHVHDLINRLKPGKPGHFFGGGVRPR